MNSNIAAVILAAGQSKRLGAPKQLVEFEGETLLRRTAKTVTNANVSKTFVVLGHQSDLMVPSLEDINVVTTIATDFADGLSHSIRRALQVIQSDDTHYSAVLFVPCDLPLLNSKHLNDLIARYHRTAAPVVCTRFGETFGTPAIFSAEIWPEFATLRGDKGARPIIERCAKKECVTFEPAAFDLDTTLDLEHWLGLKGDSV